MRVLFLSFLLAASCSAPIQMPVDAATDVQDVQVLDTATDATCGPSLSMCDGRCIDLRIDNANCGRCRGFCVGSCVSGVCVTDAATDSEACVPSGNEQCDGRDNNCNGQIDEGFTAISCGIGACMREVPFCSDGGRPECIQGDPVQEVCNGIDDDCDGVVDNNNAFLSCTQGGSCNGGVCGCTDPQYPDACQPAGTCVNLLNNRFHCGVCGRICLGSNPSCVNGQCAP